MDEKDNCSSRSRDGEEEETHETSSEQTHSPEEREQAGGGSPFEVQAQVPEASAPAQVDRLELIEPSLWTRAMTITAVVLIGGGLWFYQGIIKVLTAPDAPMWMRVMVFVPPALFALYVLYRWWDAPDGRRAITFHDDHVTLPVSYRSRRDIELDYADVAGVLMMARGNAQSVLVDTGDRTIGYSSNHFERQDGPQLLREEVFRRIRELPNASEVLEDIRDRQKSARIATSKSATATKVILGILAGFFALELWTGAMSSQLGLIRLGANAPSLVDEGQYFRLISANFLHGGWLHIILNGIALLFLGGAVEKLIGPWRMGLIYLLGAVGGAAGSYLADFGALSVGSSTAIFGLFGAFLVLHLRYWSQLPPPFRQSVRWWVIIVGLNAALPFIVPIIQIDYVAHAAGLIAGGLCTALLVAPYEELKPDRKASRAVKIVTVLIGLVFAAGLAQAGLYALDEHPEDRNVVLDSMITRALEEDDSSAQNINQIAWIMATRDEVSIEQLERLRDALHQVIETKEDELAYRDTLATLDYRLARKSTGDKRLAYIDKAIEIQKEVLLQAPDAPQLLGGGADTYAGQLARFLDYRREIAGPQIRGDLFGNAPTLKFDPTEEGSLEIRAESNTPKTARIYAVTRAEDKVIGLTQVCLPAGEDERTITGDQILSRWPNNVRLFTGLVEPADECDEPLQFWSTPAEIRELP